MLQVQLAKVSQGILAAPTFRRAITSRHEQAMKHGDEHDTLTQSTVDAFTMNNLNVLIVSGFPDACEHRGLRFRLPPLMMGTRTEIAAQISDTETIFGTSLFDDSQDLAPPAKDLRQFRPANCRRSTWDPWLCRPDLHLVY